MLGARESLDSKFMFLSAAEKVDRSLTWNSLRLLCVIELIYGRIEQKNFNEIWIRSIVSVGG